MEKETKNLEKRIKLGQTDIYVSPVGIGVLPMGPAQLALPVEEGAKLIVYALSKGMNFIDTAQYYRTHPYIRRALELWQGERAAADEAATKTVASTPAFDGASNAEPVPGSGLSGHGHAARGNIIKGERPVISSKTLATDYDGAWAAIEEERAAMGVEYIDIFLLHEVRSGQLATRQGAWQALMDAKACGLVRAIGCSTHHVDVVEQLAAMPACDIIFPLINYAGMGIRRGSSAASAADMSRAIQQAAGCGKGIYTMKALGGGNLAAHYQRALDYAFSRPGVSSVMLGFGCRQDIDDIVSYTNGTMSPSYAPDVSNKRVRVNHEDCEGCGTCIPMCAAGAISFDKKNGLATIDQSLCVTCGYCAQSCPVRAIIMY